ncbi:hypothetical protein MMC30_004225 [Trapelia coarctata]|nr:hypothetical protein [Trapelia coarctata]
MAQEDNLEEDLQHLVSVEHRLWVEHPYYKRTPQNSNLASNINSDPHVKGEEMLLPAHRRPYKVTVHVQDETQSQAHPTLPHVPMMTLRTASTNAPSVRVR